MSEIDAVRAQIAALRQREQELLRKAAEEAGIVDLMERLLEIEYRLDDLKGRDGTSRAKNGVEIHMKLRKAKQFIDELKVAGKDVTEASAFAIHLMERTLLEAFELRPESIKNDG